MTADEIEAAVAAVSVAEVNPTAAIPATKGGDGRPASYPFIYSRPHAVEIDGVGQGDAGS